MEEIWKPIPRYESTYHASNLGRIKSLGRKVWTGKVWGTKKEKILNGHIHKNDGYVRIDLYEENTGKRKRCNAHRLVMSAFYGESDLHVDHLNMDRADNRIENLEYVTQAENNRREMKSRRKTDLPSNISMEYGKFRVRFAGNGYAKHIGCFDNLEKALEARNKYAEEQGLYIYT